MRRFGSPSFCLGSRRRVPPRRLRCRSQVFPTSQRRCPPPTVPPYFRRVTLVGFALQGFGPPNQLRWLVASRRALVTFFLRIGLCSSLGLRNLREAPPPLPRMPGREPLVAFRASSRSRIGPHHQHTINVLTTDLPLLSFHLLMVRLPHAPGPSGSNTVFASRPPGPLPDPMAAALHGLPRVGAAPLSPVEPTISRFSAFGRPSCYG